MARDGAGAHMSAMRNGLSKTLGVFGLFSVMAFAACEGDEGPAGPAGGQGPAGPAGGQGPAGPGGEQGPPGAGGVDPSLTPTAKLVSGFGGEAALSGLKALSFEAEGTRWIVGEGYTPESGPSTAGTFELKAVWDVQGGDLRLDYRRELLSFFAGNVTYSEILRDDGGYRVGVDSVFGGVDGPLPSDRWASGRRQQRLLHPEIIAREIAADPARAAAAGGGVIAGALHHKLEVSDPVAPLTLWVDAASGRLTKISTLESEHGAGDRELEVFYTDWQPVAGGPAVPWHVVLSLGGHVLHDETRSAVAANPAVDANAFAPPGGAAVGPIDASLAERGENAAQFHQQFASAGIPLDGLQTSIQPVELSPGVWHIRTGSHNSLVVEQQAGVVVVEAPLYPARSDALLGWIGANIPNKPVTHVVATHFHDDHSGGLRSFVAAGARVVAGEAAVGFYREAFRARRTVEPDRLAEAPRPAVIEPVAPGAKVVLDDAQRRVSVYTIDTAHAADMVVAEVGGAVFVSDIYSPGLPGGFLQGLLELRSSVQSQGVPVTSYVGGHGATSTPADLDQLIDDLTP
jgi:glyoxylase-like metal-dependent hydrolase (beta-lactamase superfamily II)